MKPALTKAVGQVLLTFNELEETLLDIECFMNNKPLRYSNGEFEKQPVTPNILKRGEPATFIQETAESLETEDNVSR